MALRECMKILKTRLEKLQKNPKKAELALAYQEVIGDLIDNTDSCTGELY